MKEGLADSAFAFARSAIAAGGNKDQIGTALAGVVGPVVQKAQASKARADWQSALRLAQSADAIAPSANTKYFVGVAAFQVGLDALQKLNETKSCAEVRLAEDSWTTAQLAMPAGAQVSKETAASILGAINQYSANITQAKKSLCK